MRQFIKFGSILALCTVTLLIFVNTVEKSIERGSSHESSGHRSSSMGERASSSEKIGKKLLNLDNFEYTIVPSRVCDATLIIWIVTSYAGDPGPRSALRRAYPDTELRKFGITRVFLLGLLDDASQKRLGIIQAAIVNESERFGDITQGNFYEAYRNLTYKHLMGLKWATESCPNARYVMKQDDDIVINLYEIIDRLRLVSSTRKEILAGYVLRGMRPVREPANKWFVTREEFEDDNYPDFLSGWLYVASRRIAENLFRRGNARKKYFWIDDVFVTGIIRKELKLGLYDMWDLYTTDYRYLRCCTRGREKNLKCEFAIGPNGGKVELQVDFQNFAAFCRQRCVQRVPELSVGKTCVVEYEESKVQMGSARIEPIQFV